MVKYMKIHVSELSKFLSYLVVQYPRMLDIEFGKTRASSFGAGILLEKSYGDDLV